MNIFFKCKIMWCREKIIKFCFKCKRHHDTKRTDFVLNIKENGVTKRKTSKMSWKKTMLQDKVSNTSFLLQVWKLDDVSKKAFCKRFCFYLFFSAGFTTELQSLTVKNAYPDTGNMQLKLVPVQWQIIQKLPIGTGTNLLSSAV